MRFLIEYRKTISGVFIAIVMALGFLISVFAGVTSEEYELSKSIMNLLPWAMFFFFFILLIYYIITGLLKLKMEKSESIVMDDKDPIEIYSIESIFPFFSKKYRVFSACIATYIAFIILASVVLVVINPEIDMESIVLYLYIGGPIWLLATWRFFDKHLR